MPFGNNQNPVQEESKGLKPCYFLRPKSKGLDYPIFAGQVKVDGQFRDLPIQNMNEVSGYVDKIYYTEYEDRFGEQQAIVICLLDDENAYRIQLKCNMSAFFCINNIMGGLAKHRQSNGMNAKAFVGLRIYFNNNYVSYNVTVNHERANSLIEWKDMPDPIVYNTPKGQMKDYITPHLPVIQKMLTDVWPAVSAEERQQKIEQQKMRDELAMAQQLEDAVKDTAEGLINPNEDEDPPF